MHSNLLIFSNSLQGFPFNSACPKMTTLFKFSQPSKSFSSMALTKFGTIKHLISDLEYFLKILDPFQQHSN